MASTRLTTTTTPPPPLRVTATGFATYVVEVRGFSKLRKKHRGDDEYVGSEPFTVDGVDWMVCVNPDGGEGDEQGYMGVFVELVTKGISVWAHVSIGLVDWTTGRADPLFSTSGDGPVLFDAGNGNDDDDHAGSCCNDWGTGKLASWRKELRRSSRYLRRDCLKIECVVDICHSSLVFHDLPAAAAPEFEEEEAAAIVAMLNAGGSEEEEGMPRRQAVEALQQFAHDGSLPVVDDMSVDGYRDMFQHLLLAAERHGGGGGMRRLAAICERALCRCIDVESAAAMLAMAQRHGFQELRDACLQFASHPNNYWLVWESKGYAAELGGCQETFCVEMELWAKYCERRGVPACDEYRLTIS